MGVGGPLWKGRIGTRAAAGGMAGSPPPGPLRIGAELSVRGPFPPTGNRRRRAHPACKERRPLAAREGGPRGQQLAAEGVCPAERGCGQKGRGQGRSGRSAEATPTSASQCADAVGGQGFWRLLKSRWPRMRSKLLRGPEAAVSVRPRQTPVFCTASLLMKSQNNVALISLRRVFLRPVPKDLSLALTPSRRFSLGSFNYCLSFPETVRRSRPRHSSDPHNPRSPPQTTVPTAQGPSGF